MKKGARYIVTTHWGTFSLDEGAYQDYLKGELWITWKPGEKHKSEKTEETAVPPETSEKALALRSFADKKGVIAALKQAGDPEALPPFSERFSDIPIGELLLSARSSNGLRRAGVHTFGALYAKIQKEGGIRSIRNLGEKSANEITRVFTEDCYARMLPYEKALYWNRVCAKKEQE